MELKMGKLLQIIIGGAKGKPQKGGKMVECPECGEDVPAGDIVKVGKKSMCCDCEEEMGGE